MITRLLYIIQIFTLSFVQGQELIYQDPTFGAIADFGPNNDLMAIADQSALVIWDVKKNFPILERKLSWRPIKLQFGPEGKFLFLFEERSIINGEPILPLSLSTYFNLRSNKVTRISLQDKRISDSAYQGDLFVGISNDTQYLVTFDKRDSGVQVLLIHINTGMELLSYLEKDKIFNDYYIDGNNIKIVRTEIGPDNFTLLSEGSQNSIEVVNNVALIGVNGVVKSWDLKTGKLICRYDALRIINEKASEEINKGIPLMTTHVDGYLKLQIDSYLRKRHKNSMFRLAENGVQYFEGGIIENWGIPNGDVKNIDSTFTMIPEYSHTVGGLNREPESIIGYKKNREVKNLLPLKNGKYFSIINNQVSVGSLDSLTTIALKPKTIAAQIKNPKLIGSNLMISTGSEAVRIWNLITGELALSIYFRDYPGLFNKNNNYKITFIREDGYFDIRSLAEADNLRWVFDDNRLRTLPIEIFMKDFYTPNLLEKTLSNSFEPSFKRDFKNLNRVQPYVSVKVLDSLSKDGYLTIQVNATNVVENGINSGIFDIHLFNNNRLFARLPNKKTSDLNEIEAWRKRMTLKTQFDTILKVKVPRTYSKHKISAHAYNSDRIKSKTSNDIIEAQPIEVKSDLYIISIGVGDNEMVGMRLNHSKNDAESFSNTLENIVDKAVLDSIHRISLISESTNPFFGSSRSNYLKPTKTNIRNTLQSIDDVNPDDVVVVFFSGHGLKDYDGGYYLVPFDYNKTAPFASSISSKEMNDWMRNIITKQVYILIDACYSGGIVGSSYKPGPFGDFDFGQYSFDKKAPILTASQSIEDLSFSKGKGLISKTLFSDENIAESNTFYQLLMNSTKFHNTGNRQRLKFIYFHPDEPPHYILLKK